MFRLNVFWVILLMLWLAGCGHLTETAKVFWGSSTQALEEARVDAISAVYGCSWENCFDSVVEISQREYEIFINNRRNHHLVVMQVKGNVDTTEVGIFFVRLGDKKTRVEISSLSSTAKLKVAEYVFGELKTIYPEIK